MNRAFLIALTFCSLPVMAGDLVCDPAKPIKGYGFHVELKDSSPNTLASAKNSRKAPVGTATFYASVYKDGNLAATGDATLNMDFPKQNGKAGIQINKIGDYTLMARAPDGHVVIRINGANIPCRNATISGKSNQTASAGGDTST